MHQWTPQKRAFCCAHTGRSLGAWTRCFFGGASVQGNTWGHRVFWGINKLDYVEFKKTRHPVSENKMINFLTKSACFLQFSNVVRLQLRPKLSAKFVSNHRLFYHNFHNCKDSQGRNASSHLIFLGTNISFFLSP